MNLTDWIHRCKFFACCLFYEPERHNSKRKFKLFIIKYWRCGLSLFCFNITKLFSIYNTGSLLDFGFTSWFDSVFKTSLNNRRNHYKCTIEPKYTYIALNFKQINIYEKPNLCLFRYAYLTFNFMRCTG